jgi:hypothetical protein
MSKQRLLRPMAGLAVVLALLSLFAFAANAPSVVQAQRIELVDSKGQVHAALTADSAGAMLTLLDKRGQATASLHLNEDPRLALRDAAGREVAGLGPPRVQHLAQ